MAFKSIPNVPIIVNVLNALKPPMKHNASLINPDRAGNPRPAKNAIIINALKTGSLAAKPPKASFPASS